MSTELSATCVSSMQLLNTKSSETPSKGRKRKRLRRLAEDTNNNDSKNEKKSILYKLKRLLIGTLLIVAISGVLMGHILQQKEHGANLHPLRDFLSNYRKHYRQIVHGQLNYCDQRLDTQALFARIRQQEILHQEQALLQLEMALRNDSVFTAIAVVGPPGVGKSMWARALAESFPWRENVHSYAWNTYVRDDAEKVAMVQMFAEQLSDCGSNLVVIDNLAYQDRDVLKCLNDILSKASEPEANTKVGRQLIVVYVFSLNTFEQHAEYRKQHLALQQLPSTKSVDFQAFGKNELRDCIRRNARLENLTLSNEDFEEIVSSIDAARSGCKNVPAKVLMYGKNIRL